ncbi:MAG: hypothetical protein AB7G76_14790 [Steroidobacteraceae bacterium]
MNEANDTLQDQDDELTRLLTRVGPRIEPPAETREAVYLTTLLAWNDTVRSRRRLFVRRFALAASLLIAAAGLAAYMTGQMWQPAALVATARGGAALTVRAGDVVAAPRESGLVLGIGDSDESLRLDRGARVKFTGLHRAVLEAGRAYFVGAPGGAADTGRRFTLVTRFAEVTHVGTRYALNVEAHDLEVDVREGAVRIRTRSGEFLADAGTRITIDEQGRLSGRTSIATFGAGWGWAEALAPPLPIDGRPLIAVLEEIARETGRRLTFADSRVETACRAILLKGPVLDLPVGDRLFAVLVTTGLEAIENGDLILIRDQPDRPSGNGA